MKRAIILAFLLMYILELVAQSSSIPIGSWQSYLPYRRGLAVDQSSNSIFYASQWALLSINKEDLALDFISKVQGLNDMEISALSYAKDIDALVLVYQSGSIDIMRGEDIVNLDDIAVNQSILGDKNVYDIFTEGNRALLSTGFGLVELDLEGQEFGSTTFTNNRVNDASISNGFIWIATNTGVYRIEDAPEINISDFGRWQQMEIFPEILNTEVFFIDEQGGDLYISAQNSLLKWESDQFQTIQIESGRSASYVTSSSKGVLVAWSCEGCVDKFFLMNNGSFEALQIPCVSESLAAVEDEQNRLWFADRSDGYKYFDLNSNTCEDLRTDRPLTHNASELITFDNILYIATGGVTESFGYRFREDGLLTNEDNTWRAVNRFNTASLDDKNMRDFYSLEVDNQGRIYIGTFWDGVVRYKSGELEIFDKDNSSLQNSVVNPDNNRITDMDFDSKGNLWFLNHDSPRPLSVLKSDETWQNFAVPTNTNLEELTIDDQDNLWIDVGGSGILVAQFNDFETDADDAFRVFNRSNSELTVNSINSLATDNNGNVWVGTTEGPVLFACAGFAFADNCGGTRLIVESNGIAGILLSEENIRTIAIDGANRKWFGTDNGVFVQSADAEDEVFRFTEDNSPLFDNTVNDIHIDAETGEVYIATNKGVVSFRSDATEGGLLHRSELEVFPNPVRPDYSGPIAIKGLAENAEVFITDVAGRLVNETRSLGGQAIWNGLDLNGEPVAGGVYLVFSARTREFSSPDAAVAKVMVIR